MKKLFSILLLLCALGFCFSACNSTAKKEAIAKAKADSIKKVDSLNLVKAKADAEMKKAKAKADSIKKTDSIAKLKKPVKSVKKIHKAAKPVKK